MMSVGVATRTWTKGDPWRGSPIARDGNLGGFPMGARSALAGAPLSGHYGRGRCVMSRGGTLKSAPTCRPGKLLPPGCRSETGAAVASQLESQTP